MRQPLGILLISLILLACSSGDSAPPTSSVSTGGAGGSAGAGGSGAGAGGSGGSAAGAGGGTAGTGGAAGSGGSGAGAGGSAAGVGGQGGAAGVGGAGAGGTEDCCAGVACGGADPICVEGECFDLKPGECFNSEDCGGKECLGATVCSCNTPCFAPTTPGKCEGAGEEVWGTCGEPGDCMILANSCCGACGMPGLDDVDAVNLQKIDEHFKDVCGEENPTCPACASMNNPDLLAACALGQGKCVALEVSKSPFAACTKDDECVVRAPNCCGCGPYSKEQLLAVNIAQEASYMNELRCDEVDCAPCEDPQFPPGIKAVCDPETKHCRLAP